MPDYPCRVLNVLVPLGETLDGMNVVNVNGQCAVIEMHIPEGVRLLGMQHVNAVYEVGGPARGGDVGLRPDLGPQVVQIRPHLAFTAAGEEEAGTPA